MIERVRDRERTGPSCATCQGALGVEPPAICSACRAVHHALCVSAERRCTCGAPLFVPTLRAAAAAPEVHLGSVLLTFAKRELWRWLLPAPFWVVSAWVLATSERVWTEKVLVSAGRRAGGMVWVTVADVSRRRLIVGLLFFAIAPALVAWLLRSTRASTDASTHGPPPTSHLAIEWAVRLGALLWIASVAHFLWGHR
jgi:hypothetical protein